MKIEIVENPQPDPDEDEKVAKYMMLARFEVGQSSKRDETEVIIKAMRATKDHGKREEKPPPWKKKVETSQGVNSGSTGSKETEKAEIRMQALKKSLTAIAANQESSESDEDSYEEESDSEGEFFQLKGEQKSEIPLQVKRKRKL